MASLQTLGMSASLGIMLFTLTVFMGWLSMTYSMSLDGLFWIGLPALGYGIAMALNSVLQRLTCGKINPVQMATGTLIVPLVIFVFLGLTLLSIVRSPIESALSPQLRYTYGKIIPVAFYMFWAGMFGEAISSGFAQSCGQ
jgi:hypothetical protein